MPEENKPCHDSQESEGYCAWPTPAWIATHLSPPKVTPGNAINGENVCSAEVLPIVIAYYRQAKTPIAIKRRRTQAITSVTTISATTSSNNVGHFRLRSSSSACHFRFGPNDYSLAHLPNVSARLPSKRSTSCRFSSRRYCARRPGGRPRVPDEQWWTASYGRLRPIWLRNNSIGSGVNTRYRDGRVSNGVVLFDARERVPVDVASRSFLAPDAK
jgi:hypothetical protein